MKVHIGAESAEYFGTRTDILTLIITLLVKQELISLF